MDLYQTLGVARDATPEDIEAAFKAKAKQAHPDVGGDKAQFQAIALAREILTDGDKRAAYDRDGKTDTRNPPTEREEALGILHTMMAQVMGDGIGDVIYEDLVGHMRHAAQSRIGEIEAAMVKMRRDIVKLAKFASRFKSKGENNLLASIVQAKVTGIERSLPLAEKALSLHKIALELLADYSFEADPAPSMAQAQYPWGAGHGQAANFGSIFGPRFGGL